MKRMLWLGAGIAVGALVVRAVAKQTQALRPGNVAASVRDAAVGAVDSVRIFVDDVREGMAVREAEIHAAFADGTVLRDDLDPVDGLGPVDRAATAGRAGGVRRATTGDNATTEEGKPNT